MKILFLLLSFSFSAFGQSAILLEACNNIQDSGKRLECLRELTKNSKNDSSQVDYRKLKQSFISLQAVVASGVNLENYNRAILEPSKELAIFKSENPNANAEAIEYLENVVVAYNDAATIWRSSIFDTEEVGFFLGKQLPYEKRGLTPIINKYNIPTQSATFARYVTRDTALPVIWAWARQYANSAFRLLDAPREQDLTTSIPSKVEAPVLLQASSSIENPLRTRVVDQVLWNWPKPYALPEVAEAKNQGIDLLGNEGDPVAAASSGVVVFSSSKLNGYGNLIIIKHNQIYLTAYAHNQELLVKEGDLVKGGQLIAKMGKTESDRVKLYFEVRKAGKSVDPLLYLPNQ